LSLVVVEVVRVVEAVAAAGRGVTGLQLDWPSLLDLQLQ
jgi:hypothetical protein